MKEFDYVIIGGGCAGLSLAYELEINNKLKDKTLAIIELRQEYKRDKTWSFWKVFDHNFEDCVIKSWNNFTINTSEGSQELKNEKYPYQSIDSGKFYKKINLQLSNNPNVNFFKNLDEIKSENSLIFNSVIKDELDKSELWQHFQGVEIETQKDIFDDEILNLMDYELQLENYIKNNLGIKNYKINFTEKGAIPLFYPFFKNDNQRINIGSAGGMTRLSTGYTFLNIQEHSRYIVKNLNKIEKIKIFNIGKKYQFLDKIFLRVLEKHPEKMPKIFFKMFKTPSDTVIKFLSNKSNIFEDINIISKMPKLIFLKALLN